MILRVFHLRILYVFIGTALSALGLSLMIASNLGVDTLSVALFGIMNYVPIKFGYLSLSFNILVLSMAFLFDRSQIGIGSIINGIGVGVGVNFFNSILLTNSFIAKNQLLFSILGVLTFAIGIGIYVSAKLGAAALECLTLILIKISNLSIKSARIIIDIIMVAFGISIGSTNLGIGTLICVLSTGLILEGILTLQSAFFKKAD